MPHVRSLIADQGTSFSHTFVSVSLCCPSRTTILRGQYSHNTGVETNGGANGGFEAAHDHGIERVDDRHLAARRDGYRTGALRQVPQRLPERRERRPTCRPAGTTGTAPTRAEPVRRVRLHAERERPGRALRRSRRPTTAPTSTRACASGFVTRAAQDARPFFAYLPVYAPHDPATPAPRDAEPFPDAQRAAHAELQRGRRRRQARRGCATVPLMTPDIEQRVDDALPAPAPVAAGRRPGGRPAGRRRCSATASSTTPTSCSRPTTASTSASTACPPGKQTGVRRGHPRPAHRPRPGRARGAHAGRSWSATSTSRRRFADLAGVDRARRSSTAARSSRSSAVRPPAGHVAPGVPRRALARGPDAGSGRRRAPASPSSRRTR